MIRKSSIIITVHWKNGFLLMNNLRQNKRSKLGDILMAELAAGNFTAGCRIPTVRKLADKFQVSPVTVTRLLNDMVSAGKLYRKPKCGYYLAQDFPPVPRIGYLGHLPPRQGSVLEFLHDNAVRAIFDEFEKLHIVPEIFSYSEFAKTKYPPSKLEKLNGMLIEGYFLDEHTIPKLNDFNGPVVLFDNTDTLGDGPFYPYSQVTVSYHQVLKDFFNKHYKIDPSIDYVLVHGGHFNARQVADIIKRYLSAAGANLPQEICLKYGVTAEMEAYNYFSENKRDWSNCFIFSLSGYYSRGIYSALKNKGTMPDILSFDNLEKYVKLHGESEEYFTSVERHLDKAYRQAVQLLHSQIVEQKREEHTIGISAELVIRKSIKSLSKTI